MHHTYTPHHNAPAVNPRVLAGAAGALAGAAGAAYAAMQLKTMREGAAAVLLYNLIVAKGDPRLLTRDDVAALEAQVGVALGTALADEVKPIYGAFVEAIIPVGDEPLTYAAVDIGCVWVVCGFNIFVVMFSSSSCASSMIKVIAQHFPPTKAMLYAHRCPQW